MTDTLYHDTAKALGICIVSNTPVILWGSPGEGKTSVIEQIAHHYQLHMETVIASICEPSDFAGLPVVDSATGTVNYAPPQWARNLANCEAGRGLAFYDEVSTAPPANQAAMLRPILSNVVGNLDMGREVRSVAAANPADIAAGGWELAPPMANRFVHLDWSLPASVIRDGFAMGFDPVPLLTPSAESVERNVKAAKVLVGTFIASHSELKSVLPKDSSEEAGHAFPTPRSWEMAAKLYGFALASGADAGVIGILLRGAVGPAAAGEFMTYAEHLDLPDPEVLIADTSKFVVPKDRGDKVYAIAGSILGALVGNKTSERWVAVGHLLGMMAAADHADLAYTYGRRWAGMMPSDGTMPTPETVEYLGPVLQEIGAIVNKAAAATA
jgi:hypothetical protein